MAPGGRRRGRAAAGPRRADRRRSPTSPSTGCPASTSSATSPTSPSPDGGTHPQLGSVALQSGVAAADNLLADFAGKPRKPFHYHDKGIMAMIGRGAADRRGRRAPPRAARRDRLLRVARRARRADDRRAQPDRRVRRLGLGLLLRVAAGRRCSTAPTPPGSTGGRTRRPSRRRRRHDAARRHDRRPGAGPVRDDLDLPLPVRPAHARARRRWWRSCRRRGTAPASTPGCG